MQAGALVGLLRSFEPTRIYSSPAARCIQTVEPTARAAGARVEILQELYEGGSAAAVALVRSLGGPETIVLCSHGDVIPDVLDALSVDGMTGWWGTQRCQKGSTWVLHRDGDRYEKAIYEPPPA